MTREFSKSSAPLSIPILKPVHRYIRNSFEVNGMDNLGYTTMLDDIDSESDSGFHSSIELPLRRHKDSIASCASFERGSFLNLLGREFNLSLKDRRRYSISIQDDFIQEDKRYKAYLHNRFGDTGVDKTAIRNGSGIYHIYNGSVVVTDVLHGCLFIYGSSGRLMKCIPIQSGSEPWTSAATPNGTFAVTLSREKCVSVVSCTGSERSRIGQDVLEYPSGIIVDRRNRFIVTDIKQNKVHIFSDTGALIRSIPDKNQNISLKSPRHVNLSHSGDIVISDSGNHCVKVFDRHGDYVRTIGSYGSDDGQLKFPHGVCTDTDDNIFVADYYNNRVSMFSKEGEFIEHIVTAHMGLKRPQGLTIQNHPSHIILYITYGDMKANKVVAYRIVDSAVEKEIAISARV